MNEILNKEDILDFKAFVDMIQSDNKLINMDDKYYTKLKVIK